MRCSFACRNYDYDNDDDNNDDDVNYLRMPKENAISDLDADINFKAAVSDLTFSQACSFLQIPEGELC